MGLSLRRKRLHAVFVFADGYFSHAKVAVDCVDGFAVVLDFDFEVVEKGVVWMPEFWVWNAEGDGVVSLSDYFGDLPVAVVGDCLNLAAIQVFA